MKNFFLKLKEKFSGELPNEEFPGSEDEYVEIDTEGMPERKAKVLVRPFIINDFQDIKPALDSLREGYTIALVNIRPLKEKDIVELKRAVNKLKKTCDALNGDIAGFGEDWIVATPSFAQVHRSEHIIREAKKQDEYKDL